MKYILRGLKIIIVLLLITNIMGCSSKDMSDGKFEMYISRQAEDHDTFIEDDAPIFTEDDIEHYEWDSHTIIFNKDFLDVRKSIMSDKFDSDGSLEDAWVLGGSLILDAKYPDRFTIYIDNEEIYCGTFEKPLISSFIPAGAVISDVKDGVKIKYRAFGDESTIDKRDDKKIYKLLESYGLIK